MGDSEIAGKVFAVISGIITMIFFVGLLEKTDHDDMRSGNASSTGTKNQASFISESGTPSVYPVRGQVRISSSYGYRRDPFTGRRRFHNGIDIPLVKGTPVFATANGRVSEAGSNNLSGNYIMIVHDNGYKTVYAHLARIDVKRGQKVVLGNQIGFSGNTGKSTGPHLHYQVNHRGQPVDPVKLVNRLSKAQNN